MSNVTIRQFEWKYLDQLAVMLGDDVENASTSSKSASNDSRVMELRRWLKQPGLRPEQDCLIGTSDERVVGYAYLIPETPLSRGVILGKVANDFLRQKLGRDLVQETISHGKTLGLEKLHADIPELDIAGTALFKSSGFKHIRTHLHLKRTAKDTEEVPFKDVSSHLRMLQNKDVDNLTNLQNNAFTDSWGYSPNTADQIRYRIFELPGLHPDDIILLTKDECLVAYCWTHINHENRSGVIGMVGVRQDLQGHGLGRTITTAGVNHLVAKNVHPIEITVDSENTPAVRLYQSLKFEMEWKSAWYEVML